MESRVKLRNLGLAAVGGHAPGAAPRLGAGVSLRPWTPRTGGLVALRLDGAGHQGPQSRARDLRLPAHVAHAGYRSAREHGAGAVRGIRGWLLSGPATPRKSRLGVFRRRRLACGGVFRAQPDLSPNGGNLDRLPGLRLGSRHEPPGNPRQSVRPVPPEIRASRSEEHTSELQS